MPILNRIINQPLPHKTTTPKIRLCHRLSLAVLASMATSYALADNKHSHQQIHQQAKPTLPAEMYSEAPETAQVYFIQPQDSSVVPETFTVKFGLSGMGVAPAGVDKKNTGHHHLLIDLDKLPDMHLPLPSNENVHHFGGGQTETLLTLPPGKHTLQLLLGNHFHVPHKNPVISKKISITVVGKASDRK